MTNKTTARPAPLGRGLSALFGDSDIAYQPKASPAAVAPPAGGKAGSPQMLPIEWIQPSAYQPRRRFDEEAIKGLADSIRERGIVQPLMVRPAARQNNVYEIIAGERRWRAAQQAGLHEVPVIIKSFSDREAMEVALIENVQREDLSPLEEAEGYRRLMEEFNHSQDGLAKVVGKSRPHITNMLRLLTLPTAVKQMIDSGQLTMGHARALITSRNPVQLAEEIVKKGMSVRQAEALARRESDGKFAKRKKNVSLGADPNITALENELGRALGLKVKIQAESKAGGSMAGTLTVYYENLEQFDGIIRKLRG